MVLTDELCDNCAQPLAQNKAVNFLLFKQTTKEYRLQRAAIRYLQMARLRAVSVLAAVRKNKIASLPNMLFQYLISLLNRNDMGLIPHGERLKKDNE